MNTEAATLTSAIAAVLAAIFTGVNLWITGRRQHVGWTRQALEQACVDFLTAHYEHWDACARLERLLAPGSSHGSEQTERDTLVETDAVMRRCVTRFRVLTSPDLARAAIDLREFNRHRLRAIDARQGKEDFARKGSEDLAREKQRDRFVSIVQRVLNIPARNVAA